MDFLKLIIIQSLIVLVSIALVASSIAPCPSACSNRGTCQSNNTYVSGYNCVCNSGWKGLTCDKAYDPCLNPNVVQCEQLCQNIGGIPTCSCATGFNISSDNKTCQAAYACTTNNGDGPCSDTAMCFQLGVVETCMCKMGFKKDVSDPYKCVGPAIDPCVAAATNYCDNNNANCTKHLLGFNCTCKEGFIGDGITCADINECKTGQTNLRHKCHADAICDNQPGSYNCTCKPGFQGNGTYCTDLNECTTTNTTLKHNCHADAICSNQPGSYKCICKAGFQGNGTNCTDINECTATDSKKHDCAPEATCKNNAGSYNCTCNTGYSGNGKTCTDIDECTATDSKKHDCAPNATCKNTAGSFNCTCKTGYSGNGKTCTDINECTAAGSKKHDCAPEATCENVPAGSFTCTCKKGYTGNGKTCTDINECTANTHNCHKWADCINVGGGFLCKCKPGYKNDGKICVDIDECKPGPKMPCAAKAKCSNTVGTYTCKCNDGYAGDGRTCTDINECTEAGSKKHDCALEATCENVPAGSFKCKCKKGYSGGGTTCTDINECTTNDVTSKHKCAAEATCKNTVGSYTCSCKEGYTGNGQTCEVKGTEDMSQATKDMSKEAQKISDAKTVDQMVSSVDTLVKKLDATQPPPVGDVQNPSTVTGDEKKYIREEMVTGVQNYVDKTNIKDLAEAQKIGEALDLSTNNKVEMSGKCMDIAVTTSIEVLKKTPKQGMTLKDLEDLSKAVSRGPANVLGALFDTPEVIPLDVDRSKGQSSQAKKALSKDLMAKADALIKEMKDVVSGSLDAQAAFFEVDAGSFGLKMGKRDESFLKKKEPIVIGAVEATFDEGLEAVGDLSFSLTTYARNPYLYGDDSEFTNTPVLSMEVKDKSNKPPAPSIFSGGSAMMATITSKLKDNDKQSLKVQTDDIPERGQVHGIAFTHRHGYMRLTFLKEFTENVTLLGQMDIQPGDVDYDFKYVISDAIVSRDVKDGCKIVANQNNQEYSFFVYNSCFKKLGTLKVLFKLASGQTIQGSLTQGAVSKSRRRLLGKTSYTVSLVMIQPRAWNPVASAWEIVDWIEVLPESSSSDVKFKSNFFGTITSGLFVPPNTINFAEIFPNFLEKLRDSPVVLATILAELLLFLLLLMWTRRMDKKDFHMWVCAPLVDNEPRDQFCYRLNLFTSSRPGAGTTANVFVIIIGEKGATEPRALYDGYRENFQRGSISSFMLKNNSPIGRPQYVFVWHDGEGGDSDWHLSHIMVEDLYQGTCDYFTCGSWLSDTKDDHRTNRLLRVTHPENISGIGNLFHQHSKRFMFDTNIWFSMFKRPNKSRFTRVQRLCCCTAALFLIMVTNAMWYRAGNTGSSSAIHIGPFRISFRTIFIGLMCSIIILPPTVAMIEIFSRTHYHRNYKFVEIRRKQPEPKKPRLLPWWCVFIGYFLVILSILCGAFFTFMYSLDWGGEKSYDWLSTLFFSVFETVILIQPGKMLLVALIMTCILQIPSDSDRGVEDEFLLTDVPENVNQENIPVAHSIPDLPDDLDNCQESEATRKERMARDKTLFTIARQTGVQFLYLVLLMIICSSNRGKIYYDQNLALKTAFALTKESALVRHADYGQLYTWLKKDVIPALYPDNNYNGDALKSYDRTFIDNMDGLRVGPARLRQKRIKQGFCSWNKIVKKCAGDFEQRLEENGDYLTHWRTPTTTTIPKSPFVYTSAHKNDIPLYGEYATFDGGGYVAELGTSSKTAQLVLDQLFKTNWMDRLTRAVMVEATIYNANVNLFSCLRLMIETPAVGGIFITQTVESFRPYPYVDAWDLILLVLQVIWILVLFYLIYVEIKMAKTFKWEYAADPWTYVQILNIMTSFASAALYIVRVVFVIRAIEDVKNNIGEYVSFDKMLEIDLAYTAALAFISFICILQILKPLSFNYFFALLKNVMSKASNVLFFCFIFIVAIWTSFAIATHFVLGRSTANFRTFARTLWTLLRMTIGIIKFPEAMETDTPVKRIIFTVFTFIVYMVLMNLVVTIFLDMYSAVKASKRLKGFDKELNEHFWKRVLMVWNAFINKEPHAWSYDAPKKTAVTVTGPFQSADSYRTNPGNMHIDQIVKISTMIHKTMGNAFKKYSNELENVRHEVRIAKAASDDMSRKLLDTKEDLDATKETVSSIKKAINDALAKRNERDWLRKHPDDWTKHSYFYDDGTLALQVAAMPDEFSNEYLSVEKLDSHSTAKMLTSPDMVEILQPVCIIHTTEDFLIEDSILTTLPVHGGEVDQRKEIVLKARIYGNEEYEEFPADHVQVDGTGLIGLRSSFAAVPESLAAIHIWRRDYAMIGPDGGEVVSSCDNRVKVTFQSGTFHTIANVILQVKFIDMDDEDQVGSSDLIMLTLSQKPLKHVDVVIPFSEPTSPVEKMKHLLTKQGDRDWFDDYTTYVNANGSEVNFQVMVPRPGEIFCVFAKSGHSSLVSRDGLEVPRSRKEDPVTDVYLNNLAVKMGSDWIRAIYALDGGRHHRAAHTLKGNQAMTEEEKGASVLKRWLNNQQVSTDKIKLLREAYQNINRPDLVADLDLSAEVFRRYTEERVQDLNLSKAFRCIIKSEKVVRHWQVLARRLGLDEDTFRELETRDCPLSISEKCFEILSKWRAHGKDVTVRILQKHLKALGCSVAARKMTDFM